MATTLDVTSRLANAPVVRLCDHIAFCMDASSSMADNADSAFAALRQQDDNVRKLMQDPTRDTHLNIYSFADNVVEISTRSPIVRSQYRVYGNTALYDAIGTAVSNLQDSDHGLPEESFMVVVFTDGEENRSRQWKGFRVRELIKAKQARGNWTFVVLCPRGKKSAIVADLGIPAGNVKEWDSTDAGETRRVSEEVAQGTQAYFQQSAADPAVRSTRAYFTPDLSGQTVAEAKRKLQDVTTQYRRIAVPKETRIDVFAAYHTSKDYVPGTVFYPLTKTEKVREGIELLLRDKTTKQVFGGNVRGFLGLQTSGEVRVEPGNHANWDIFIQSQSLNRLLVRGAHVLIKS